MNRRSFFLPDKSAYVVLEPDVLEHMYSHAQRRYWQKEAGGQIFSEAPEQSAIIIKGVTGPNRRDKRQRHGYEPDPQEATIDRSAQLLLGRYPVGLWHTHPEATPSPSGLDRKSTKEWLMDFQGVMHGFLLVIIGNVGEPPNMAVWLARTTVSREWICLEEQ